MTTARDLINQAFLEAGILGVGQTLLAEDINTGYTRLYQMMALWQESRWLVPALVTVDALGNGQISNTIGPGGHFDYTIRPDQITSGYFVQINTGNTPVSLPLRQITSRENYNLIAVKNLNSYPEVYFYDGAWPLGNIYVWPIPSASYRLYFTIKTNLNFPEMDTTVNPNGLDTVFTLPLAYEEAIMLNLAIRLCSSYGKNPKPVTVSLAKVALNKLKAGNAQISELQMPSALRRGKAFSIWNPDGY